MGILRRWWATATRADEIDHLRTQIPGLRRRDRRQPGDRRSAVPTRAVTVDRRRKVERRRQQIGQWG